MKGLRVLHVGKYYPPHMGGIETHLQTLCEALSQVVQVEVVVANDGRSDREECVTGVPVTRLGTKLRLSSAPLCPRMAGLLRRSKADLIHIHLPNPGAVLAYLSSGRPGPLVVTYHSDTPRQPILGKLFEPVLHRFLRGSAAILVTSATYLRTSDILTDHTHHCRIVPLGIHVEQFAACAPEMVGQIRRKYGNRIVLAVGRHVYYKGLDYLIEAMARVDARLLLIGDGPLRARLEQLARSRGLADRVRFLGVVPSADFVPYYHAADVFVLPSVARSEAFGIVQVEAMAAGVPVINTQLDSGVPFVSPHGVTGLTVPPADPVALAGAINRLLDDPATRARYGAAAQLRAREEFTVEAMTNRTLDVYGAVLNRPVPTFTRQTVTRG